MKVPFIKSRNFSSFDVARNEQDRETDPVQFYLMAFVHGHAQGLRDSLAKKFGNRFQGIVITSANRNSNNSKVEGASKTSHHMYRVNANNFMHVAYDIRPIGITLQECFEHVKATVRGECYLNRAQGIVHVAPVQMEEEYWIK